MPEHVIALAVDSHLYAPLYIAQEAEFFGTEQVAFGTLNMPPPTQVPVNGRVRDAAYLDQQVDAIFAPFDNDPPCLITVCDPMHALLHNSRPGGPRVHLTGALVVKPACWVFNCNSRFDRVVAELRNGTSLITHPPGMTADTLARWMLRANEVPFDDINRIVQPIQPGEELNRFESGLAAGETCAAVSLDYASMSRLQTEHHRRFGICFHYDKVLESYLMTGLLVRQADLDTARDDIACVLNGVQLALELLRNSPRAAFVLLKQHYARRATEDPSEAILERKYLQPLLPPKPFNDLHLRRMLETCAHCYSASVVPTNMADALARTWDIYSDVQSDIIPRVAGVNAALDASALPLGGPAYADPVRVRALSNLCLVHGERRIGQVKHPDTNKLMRWLSTLRELRASSFQAVGRFLVADPDQLRSIRGFVADVKKLVKNIKQTANPPAFLIVGHSGSGKDRLVAELVAELQAEGLIGADFSVNIAQSKADNLSDIVDTIATRLKNNQKRPIAILVNEIDKRRDAVYSPFLPAINVDSSWLEKSQLTDLAARRTVWFFAGTLSGSRNSVAEMLRRKPRETAAPDFLERVGERHIISLEAMSGPIQNLWRYIAAGFVKETRARWRVTPELMTAELVLQLATTKMKENRDITRAMELARAIMVKDKRRWLRSDDIFRPTEVAAFRTTYAQEVDQLDRRTVKLKWNIE